MHILVSNDDGPPSAHSSPYVLCFVRELQKAGHVVSVCLPSAQRSWVGKAHLYGHTLTPTYYTPPAEVFGDSEGVIHKFPASRKNALNGAIGTEAQAAGDVDPDAEWILLDGTPASAVQVGLHHYFASRGPIDLVVSGPNFGRNATACFALSSGTLGAALEAATCGVKSIAMSFAFTAKNKYDPEIIAEACKQGVRITEALVQKWPKDSSVDLYTVNVPLEKGILEKKVLYADILQNYWDRSVCTYKAVDAPGATVENEEKFDTDLEEEKLRDREGAQDDGNVPGKGKSKSEKKTETENGELVHRHFKWEPDLGDVFRSVRESKPGNDGWLVAEGFTSITPLKANFMHAATHLHGKELEL